MLPVETPFKIYTGLTGQPLNNGYVYFGVANQNPITSPITVYWDAAGTQPAAQPLRTVNGYIMRAGTPANVFVGVDYSELVNDSKGRQVFYARTSQDFSISSYIIAFIANMAAAIGASLIGFLQQGVSAVVRTVENKLFEQVSVWDFMSTAMRTDALSGTPVLDHAPAWNAAITALGGAGRVLVPRMGTAAYLLKSTVYLGTSNAVDSSVVIDIDPGVLIQSTLPNLSDVLFDVKNIPGHFNNQGIKNLKVQSTNGNGSAMKFSGQCFGSFENLYIEGFNCGIYISNAGTSIYNEFIRFNNVELHINTTAILLHIDGGTDTSMHGLAFKNTTVNVGAGQVGLQHIDICWYNGDADIKFFSQPASTAIIKMSTSGTTTFKGVFISGSITCEGTAAMTGVGRFYLSGDATFLSGVTDTLISPDAWEQGFMAYNYIKSTAYGASGLTVSEVPAKSGSQGTIGPVATFAQLTKADVQSLVANCYTSHAGAPGNGFYTGYSGFHTNYGSGVLGCFLASDGTEYGTFAPTATQCAIKHNTQFIIRYDGVNRTNSTEGYYLGSGGIGIFSGTSSPEGVLTASPGSVFYRRDGVAGTLRYQKDSGAGNTGWIAKL